MSGPIAAAGAVANPTKYAALSMGARQFTGLWTQRSPYRDAAVPYLAAKFYSGSRFDSILDGVNREISVDLTDKRAPGSIVFNDNIFPAAESFYAWKTLRNSTEAIRVLEDGIDGTLYDATPGQKSSLFTKSAGAGPNRILGLPNAQLYIGNGVDQKKWLFPGGWQAGKAVTPGTLINQGAEPGTLYMALGGITVPIVATAVSGGGSSWQHLIYVNPAQVPVKFANLVGVNVTFSGLTTDTALNGQTLPVASVLSSTLGIFEVNFTSGTAQAYTPDTGSATTGNGTTGGGTPSFDATRFHVTQDAGQQWKCYGPAIENTGLAAPLVPPTLTPVTGRFWQPNMNFPQYTSLLDSNGNIEVVASVAGTNRTGTLYPQWSVAPAVAQLVATNLTGTPTPLGNTFGGIYQNVSNNVELHSGWGDVAAGNSIAYYELLIGPTNPPTQNTWGTTFTSTDAAGTGSNGKLGFNFSVPPGWFYELQAFGDVNSTPGYWDSTPLAPVASGISTPGGANAVTKDGGLTWYNLGQPGIWQADAANAGVTGSCLIDSNNNLQWLFNGIGGTSGVTQPAWGTTLGATTTDGGLTWVCISTGGSGVALTYQTLQYSYSLHGVDGSLSTAAPLAVVYGGILGTTPAVLSPTLIVSATSAGMFADTQTDTIWIWRTAQGQPTPVLEDQIPADGLTDTFSYGEAGIADTSILGLAALNPLIPAPINGSNNPPTPTSLPMCYAFQRQWWADGNLARYSGGPDTLAANGNTTQPPNNFVEFLGQVYDIIPVTVQNGGLIVYTSSGIQIILGTGAPGNTFYATSYYNNVNVTGYNCVCVQGTTMYVLETNLKLSSIAIQYPFNPNTGYTQIGFPIGDQLRKVTTGGLNAKLYSSSTAFLSWNSESTTEDALYVADGTLGWFRMSEVSPPESGIMWHPRRNIVGGTSAVQAMETAPGQTQLLIGPPVTNYALYSQAFENSIWGKNQIASVTDNSVAAPDGSMTAAGVSAIASPTDAYVAQTFAGYAIGQQITFSVWLKVPTSPPSQPLAIQINDGVSLNATFCTLTTSWQRFSVTRTLAASGFVIFIGGGGTMIDPNEGIQVAWAQVERGAVATDYVETTAVPSGAGPILCRDDSGVIYNDNGTKYPSWDAKGVNLLCSTGQWAETVHISTKSAAVGKRPIVSVLLGEIKPSSKRPYRPLNLDDKSNDPSRSPRSESVYSDRYPLKQSGINTLSDSLLTKFDYGEQDEPDELLDWGIYAREHDEREEQVASTK